ncbi:unnamed protein product, partial [marine sediment metagenome]
MAKKGKQIIKVKKELLQYQIAFGILFVVFIIVVVLCFSTLSKYSETKKEYNELVVKY